MKTKINYLKMIAVTLCLLFNSQFLNAQFLNGDFQLGTAGCNAGTSWAFAPSPNSPQYVQVSASDRWIDITPCGSFGNGSWLEQTINTVPGKLYYIKLDLGAHLGWQVWDAGVNIHINGTALNSGTTRLFNNTFGTVWGSINWKTVRSCTFRATGNTTTVRITGIGANPLVPSYPSPNAPGVMGLDNVELVDADNLFSLTAAPSGECNKVCFTVNNLYTTEPPAISNIDWYVDNVLESNSASNTYCRKFPKNITKQIKAVVSFFDNCTTVTQTLTMPYTATDDCPCDIQSHAQLVATGLTCNSYKIDLKLDPGYVNLFTQWTLDGQVVSGTLSKLIAAGLSPGTHIVCANIMGGLDGEPDNICCARICIEIHVGELSVTECGVLIEDCYQLNTNDPHTFVDLLTCEDCKLTVQNAASAGPWIHLGYGSGNFNGYRILQREYYDYVNCRKCIVTFTVANANAQPAQFITINNNGNPCVTIDPSLLPWCLRSGGNELVVMLNNHPETLTNYAPGAPITLCCDNVDNVPNPTYYIYAKEDPCCWAIVTLNCDGGIVAPKMQNSTSAFDISSYLNGPQLKLSPNPTSSVFNIESEMPGEVYESIEIMDMSGRIVLVKTNATASTQIDMSKFSKGTYFVNIKTQMGTTALKLIKSQE